MQGFISDLKNDKSFDLVMALGLLHRVEDPIGLMRQICNVTNYIIFEFKYYKSKEAVAIFAGGESKRREKLNKLFFIFSFKCIENILLSFGFKVLKIQKDNWFSRLKYKRGLILAQKK